jgi:steroid delta-isomerase-like uncharacterized protein
MTITLSRRHLLGAATILVAGSIPLRRADAADIDPAGVVRGYMDAWNAHDAEAASRFLAESVTYYDASVGLTRGRDEARDKVIAGFLNAAPDAVWERRGEIVVQGTSAAFEWTFSGTNTGAWPDGTPATGKVFRFDGATVMTVEEGLIWRQSDYYDALGFYKQLGLM